MDDTIVIDTIRCNLEMEISNRIEVKRNNIIVYLGDGTTAKILTKNVA